jgi:hypothetical protein
LRGLGNGFSEVGKNGLNCTSIRFGASARVGTKSPITLAPQYLGLTLRRDISVTAEGGQHLGMPKVLAPGFQRFKIIAFFVAVQCERFAKAVRVEIR